MKKHIIIFVLTLSLIMLSGCQLNKSSDPDDDFDLVVDDPTTLSGTVKIALPSAGGKREILEAVLDEYREARPDVTVEVEWKASDDFYLSYQIDVSTGLVFPDVAFIDHVYIQSLAALNLIIPVDQSIEQVSNLYIDNLVNATKLDDKIYGYPFSANTLALYYNKDILGDRPVPTTYDEFLAVGDQIYQQEQAKPSDQRNQVFSLSTGSDYKNFGALVFVSWLARANGTLLSDDLRTSLVDQTPTTDVLTMWKDIVDRGWANPALSNEGLFYMGKVAFLEMGNWINPIVFGDNAQADFGVAPLFSLSEGGQANSALGLYALCVTKQEDENRMRLAADLSQFISTNTQVQVDYAKNSNLLPVTKEAALDSFFQEPEWQVFIDTLPTAALRPGSPEWPTIQDEIGNMFMKVVLGRNTIAEAVADAHQSIQEKLDDFYEG
jgi:ABC-type glycerol-3-phosphate transport system substrate-binding protein